MHKKGDSFAFVLLVLFPLVLQLGARGGCGCFNGEERGKIQLAWNANRESDIAGYMVYYGTAPGKYGVGIDAGNVTNFTLDSLRKGQRYYISVKTYNKSGQPSIYSQEVSGIAT